MQPKVSGRLCMCCLYPATDTTVIQPASQFRLSWWCGMRLEYYTIMYSTTTLLLALLAGSAPDKPQTHYNTEPPPYDDDAADDATVSSPNQQRATRLKEHNRNFTSIIIHLSLCTVAFLLHSSAADHSRDDISYHQSSHQCRGVVVGKDHHHQQSSSSSTLD